MFFEDLGIDMEYVYRTILVNCPELVARKPILSIDQVSALKNKLCDLLGMPHLGLALGKQVRSAAFLPPGSALYREHQPTFKTLLQSMITTINATYPTVSLRYLETDHVAGLQVTAHEPDAASKRMAVETVMVNVSNHFPVFLGEAVGPECMTFDYGRPSYAGQYDQYFSCDLKFGAEHSAILIPKELLHMNIAITESSYACVRDLYLSGSNLPAKLSSLSKRLHTYLADIRVEDGFPTLDVAADHLCISPRTLRRHLNMLNTSYFEEIQAYRKQSAIHLLLNTRYSITDIALQLGFYDSSAFNNAFKKWMGRTPRQFRANPTPDDALQAIK